ncbi:hypothetical protein Hypma_006852 [Hypsizygus marmoreus]|uniref:Uncharacterized protein n=1 Tax=Hypsizygus marmoreus TaxID=39966 RepID=A0A369JX67_HYPMA|nr:hypothetical protein Hypma_006852 [Hypsizygus marmoreus]
MPQLSIEGSTQRHQDDLASVARPPEVDRELLVKAACRSFELMEPWHQATSEHPIVVDIIHQVQAHGDNFYTAISTSRDAAQAGYNFCLHFATVLENILDPTISVVELHEFINNMVTIAGQAQTNAEKVVMLFRTMRIGISNITNDVPAKVAKLKDEEQLALKKAKIGQKRARQLNMIGKGLNVAGVAAGASAVFVFPPALIVLPVVLPIMSLVAELIENKLSKRTEKRTKQAQDCREAITQLQRVTHDMVELENAVESFAQYWSGQEIVLNMVKGRIEELRYLKSIKLTLRMIAKSWDGVAKSLLDYAVKMKTLLSYVPHRPAISNEQQGKALDMTKATTRIPRRQNTLKRSRSDDFLPDGSTPDKGSLLAPPSRTEARSKSSDARPTGISTDPSTGILSNERDKSPQSGSTRHSTQGTQIKPKLLGQPPDVVSRSRSSQPHATPSLDMMRASNTRRSSSHEDPRSPNVLAVPPSTGSRDGRKSLNNHPLPATILVPGEEIVLHMLQCGGFRHVDQDPVDAALQLHAIGRDHTHRTVTHIVIALLRIRMIAPDQDLALHVVHRPVMVNRTIAIGQFRCAPRHLVRATLATPVDVIQGTHRFRAGHKRDPDRGHLTIRSVSAIESLESSVLSERTVNPAVSSPIEQLARHKPL